MKPQAHLSHWAATASPLRTGAELASGAIDGSALSAVLSRIAPRLGDADFLIVNAYELLPAEVRQAQETLMAAGSTGRFCLAGQREGLEHLAEANLEQVGFVLDFNLQTSCSELLWDRFEAVRFGTRFVAQAVREIRVGCALEAILGLARELGMRTLGSGSPSQVVAAGFAFDYLPTSAYPNKTRAEARRAVTSFVRTPSSAVNR
jgi:hypothetical protein